MLISVTNFCANYIYLMYKLTTEIKNGISPTELLTLTITLNFLEIKP